MPDPEKAPRITRLFKGEIEDVSESKRTIIHTITTDAIDRYHEVISARGVQLDNYRDNPVVLWAHDCYTPIAKNIWIKPFKTDGRSGLKAKTLFGGTDTAQEIFDLYATGFLNGWSIGACPDYKAMGPPSEDEIKARPELKKCRCIYRRVELVEYSACSVPANPEALGNEVGKHISTTIRKQIEDGGRWDQGDEPDRIRPEELAKVHDVETHILDAIRRRIEAKLGYDPDELEKLLNGDPTVKAPTGIITEKTAPAKVLPELIGRTFEEALAQTRAMVKGMTSRDAAEAAARDTIDRLKGRV